MKKTYVAKMLFKLVSNSSSQEMEETFKYIRTRYGREAEVIARMFDCNDPDGNQSLIAELSNGVAKMVDSVGRIVIPSEFREQLEVENGGMVSLTIKNDCLIIKKFIPSCSFCGSFIRLSKLHEKQICEKCRQTIIKSTE